MLDYKKLLNRFYPTGFLFLCGLLVIIYAALGFLYMQQGSRQDELETQINALTIVLAKPPPKKGELENERDAVLEKLKPITDVEAIALLVDIASKSGIDISETAGKFIVPSASINQQQVGSSQYRVITFSNIVVQGDYEDLIAFTSDIDSGTTMENMVLTRMITSEVETVYSGEEERRRTELQMVINAVKDMMAANNLLSIPNPLNVQGEFASNLMGDNPETETVFEGFPDIFTSPAQKGYTGELTPRDGYVLYGHDLIAPEDPSQYITVSYITDPVLEYYYTCESDGTVRQWDGPDTTEATEYFGTELSKIETRAVIDIVIYTALK
jgi:hypothetical protein